MKLLNRVGDALLARLVPGIDAEAGCGTCRRAGSRCDGTHCCSRGVRYRYLTYLDACGNVCGTACDPATPCGQC
jgi:hypothetical protein